MATKNNPGKFDCYENAEDDEPMFVLLARDRHAPALIWLWATLRELEGEEPTKVNEARDCMVSMMQWAADRGRKTCGVGVAAMAAMMELVRGANAAVKVLREDTPKNKMTDMEQFRLFLCAAEPEKTEAN